MAVAVERAKQITMAELNAVMQVGLRWMMGMIVLDEKWMTFHILPPVFSLINFVLTHKQLIFNVRPSC